MNMIEIIQSFDKQQNYIQNELRLNKLEDVVKDTELLLTWLKIKLNEINEKKE